MLRGLVISDWSADRMTPGGGGREAEEGKSSQYLEPVRTAFQALGMC